MKELERKQTQRRILYSIPSLFVLLAISFWLVKGAMGVMDKKWASSERLGDLEDEAAALVLREEELRASVERLGTEEGIKDEIRERFSVAQVGEYMAVIVEDEDVSSSTDDSARAWYKRFWSAIIGDK